MQKILIVDDSEINREILAAMLEKTYEIDMAKDGQGAIEILEKKWETYQIVLLDLNMPVINGYEVLKVMEEKQWLDSLPVICISAETSEASIGKAYELGATDYFTRPFDTAVVLRRVHNTIALYAKASSSLHDAMEMLSGIFYRIIKINLSTDTYRTLKNISDDFRSPLDGIKSISQRLRQYGEEYVHEEDQEAFLEFCDSENLRKNFSEEDTERISMSYRCRNGQEFRWVSMEIIKSTEYAKDNEVVVLYLRDINTDYLKQLDMVLSRSKGSVGMVNVNVTDGTCKSGSSSLKNLELQEEDRTLDQYINRISTSIPQEDGRRSFTENFSRKHMLDSFEKGHTVIQENYPVYSTENHRPQLYRVTAEMVRNSFSGQIEAILYFTDITGKYLAEKNVNVVNGLALGCDTEALKGTIAGGGRCIGILPAGLDDILPKSNQKLADEIVMKDGCLISEYPVGTPVKKYQYVRRDRLQSGLSDGVLIVEAEEQSGTMHTVEFAQNQYKRIACYYHKLVELSSGNRKLEEAGQISVIEDKKRLEEFVEAGMKEQTYEQLTLF